MKKRYKFLIVLIAWETIFYYGLYIGWQSDRSYEPNLKKWIGKSFQLNEPVFMYRTSGWDHILEVPNHDGRLTRNFDEMRADPGRYNKEVFSSLFLLEPGTRFKIMKVFDRTTWSGGPHLDIKAKLLSGPQAGKKVLASYLFQHDLANTQIFGPRDNISITQLD